MEFQLQVPNAEKGRNVGLLLLFSDLPEQTHEGAETYKEELVDIDFGKFLFLLLLRTGP
jgi:hypothetical protein